MYYRKSENIIYSKLIKYLAIHKIMISNQFGFLRYHFSYVAHMNKLIISLEKWDIVVGVFLEFSKTFDTVDHDILLSGLKHHGNSGNVLNSWQSYLTDPKQYVNHNEINCATNSIRCGVFRAHCFVYFSFLSTICILYASTVLKYLLSDDTNLLISGVDIDHMQNL